MDSAETLTTGRMIATETNKPCQCMDSAKTLTTGRMIATETNKEPNDWKDK